MSMDRDKALKIWDDVFGKNVLYATDCFGTWMYRDDYGDSEKTRVQNYGEKAYHFGWDIDHIRPKSDFDNEHEADFFNNYEPMHKSNNRTKSDNYPHFNIKDNKYKIVVCEVCKSKGCKGYGIVNSETEKRIDWKGTTNRYYL